MRNADAASFYRANCRYVTPSMRLAVARTRGLMGAEFKEAFSLFDKGQLSPLGSSWAELTRQMEMVASRPKSSAR